MNNPFPNSIKYIGVTQTGGFPKEDAQLAQLPVLFETWGKKLVFPTANGPHERFLAAADDERIRRFHEIVANEDVDALMAEKGGYGTARIASHLDWNLIRSRNLPVIGYSDVTALHLCALKHGCRNHIYGPMLASTFAQPDSPQLEQTLQSLADVLEKKQDLLTLAKDQVLVLKPGQAEAPIVPATLSVLVSLIGTPAMPDLTNCILAVEDVNEAAYRIDAYLNQLRQANILAKLKGLVFGQFTNTEDVQFLPEVLQDAAKDVNGPVVANVQFGHCSPALSLPVGAMTRLVAENTNNVSMTRSPLDDYQSHIYTTPDGDTLGYRFLEPKNADNGDTFPLVLFLHGAGERGCDNNLQLIHVLPKFVQPDVRNAFPCFVCAPQCPAGEQWVNTPWALTQHTMPESPSKPLEAVFNLLDELLLNYPIDPKRIYVMGISMGGYGTWDAISRHPERFAAAVPICGGADLAQATQIAQVPVWAFHGGNDTVVPTVRSQNICRKLKEMSAPITYTEVPNCGHDSWNPAINTPELLPWLFSNHK